MAQARTKALLSTSFLAAAAFFGMSQPVYPVHDTTPNVVFELDGNVADTAAAGEDWSTANFGGLSGNQLAKTGVVADVLADRFFTGGGSKDDLDLNGSLSGAGGWKHKLGSGGPPDKNDITNAYAVAYNVANELVIYAGADRFDNSGDAFMGFWFFQNQISLGTGGGGGGSPFIGRHAVGDVLVLANYTGGGTTVNIEVFKWIGSSAPTNPANVVNGVLERIAGGANTPATCGSSANDNFCAITNATGGETPPWPYLSKDGTASLPTAAFLELGINISKVFAAAGGGAVPCFSSFMAETRSSSSVSAVLKDFALGSFPVCGIAVSKVCKNPVLASNTTIGYTVEGRVQNTGFGTLTNLVLTDAPRSLGAISYHACAGNLPDGNAITFNGSLNPLASVCYRSSIVTPVNGEDDTITATATAGSAQVSAQQGADCPPLQLSPELSVTKNCTTTLASVSPYLVVQVNFSGEVCNVQKTGSTAITGVEVKDTREGVTTGNLFDGPQTLAVGECKPYSGSYLPTVANNRLVPGGSTFVPGLAQFTDTATASGSAPFSTVTPQSSDPAVCTLCPTCTTAGDQCTGNSCPASKGLTQSKPFKQTR